MAWYNEEFECPQCGIGFYKVHKKSQKYCSALCADIAKSTSIESKRINKIKRKERQAIASKEQYYKISKPEGKTYKEVLKSFIKSNKQARLRKAKKEGFDSVDQYLTYLKMHM